MVLRAGFAFWLRQFLFIALLLYDSDFVMLWQTVCHVSVYDCVSIDLYINYKGDPKLVIGNQIYASKISFVYDSWFDDRDIGITNKYS